MNKEVIAFLLEIQETLGAAWDGNSTYVDVANICRRLKGETPIQQIPNAPDFHHPGALVLLKVLESAHPACTQCGGRGGATGLGGIDGYEDGPCHAGPYKV